MSFNVYHQGSEKTTTEWEKIFANHKAFVSRIYAKFTTQPGRVK